MTKVSSMDMTEGKVFVKITAFVLPLMFTNLLQVLYNTADIIIVNLSSEPDAVGSIGVTGPFINLIVNVFIGFATGANVMVARHIGARNDVAASKTVHTSLVMSVIFGVVSGIIGIIMARPILALMGAEDKLLDLATLYTQIYFAGVPFISITNYVIGIMRAKGDTRTPLFVLSGAGLINVCFNILFVVVFDMSVDGVAIATTISNILSTVVLLVCLARDKGVCRFSFKKLCLDRKSFIDILKIGLPAGIQGSLFSISNMIIQSSILQVNNAICPVESEFQPVVKGNSATSSLEGFVYTATNSVCQASTTFTSQNAGANKYDRVYNVMKGCYSLTFIIAIFFSGLIFVLRDPLLSLYGVKKAAEGTLEYIAYDTAYKRIIYIVTTYFLLAFMETGSGVVRGLGKSTSSTVISLVGSCLLRILWIVTVFKAKPTLEIIFLSYPLSWGLTAIIQFAVAIIYTKKYEKESHLTE